MRRSVNREVPLGKAHTERPLNRTCVDDRLLHAEHFNGLITHSRDKGHLKFRGHRPAACRFRCLGIDAKSERNLNNRLLLLFDLDVSGLHRIGFDVRDTHSETRNDFEGPEVKTLLSLHAGRKHRCIGVLIHESQGRRDVVGALGVRNFPDTLHARITEHGRAVQSKAVVLGLILDVCDIALDSAVTVLEGNAESRGLCGSKFRTEGAVPDIGLKAGTVIEVISFVAFTANVNPKVRASLNLTSHAIGDSFRKDHIRTANHRLDTHGSESGHTFLGSRGF